MDFVAELWRFMRARKKYWLLPVLLMMVVFGGLVVLTKGSVVAPFIYTIFSPSEAGPWHILGLSRQRRVASGGRAHNRRRAGGAVYPAETRPLFSTTCDPILPGRSEGAA